MTIKIILFSLLFISKILISSCCVAPCGDEFCCVCLQNGNPETGAGYYEYSAACLDGGLHCIDNTGCRLCYNPVPGGTNFGNRPVCGRFGGTYDPDTACSNEICCIDKQGNNLDDGNSYLEFWADCATNPQGTENCIQEHVGCRLCYRPGTGRPNIGNRPLCLRYLSILI